MRIRYIDEVLLLIIANFVVWSWALEKLVEKYFHLLKSRNCNHE